MHGGRHGAQLGLPGEQRTEGVCDMDNADVGGLDSGAVQRVVDDLEGELGEVDLLAGEVAREIALTTAENPDVLHSGDATTTKRVTRGPKTSNAVAEIRTRIPATALPVVKPT